MKQHILIAKLIRLLGSGANNSNSKAADVRLPLCDEPVIPKEPAPQPHDEQPLPSPDRQAILEHGESAPDVDRIFPKASEKTKKLVRMLGEFLKMAHILGKGDISEEQKLITHSSGVIPVREMAEWRDGVLKDWQEDRLPEKIRIYFASMGFQFRQDLDSPSHASSNPDQEPTDSTARNVDKEWLDSMPDSDLPKYLRKGKK
jgi:hypothetical protein